MVHPQKLGMVIGTVAGGVHLVWSIIVALGWGQGLVGFILWAHMMHMNSTVGPFNLTAAITLIVVTAAIGYVIGYAAGTVWNKVHK